MVLTPINELIAEPWQVDIQKLFEAFANESDEIKKNLYVSWYTYVCKKGRKIFLIVQAF